MSYTIYNYDWHYSIGIQFRSEEEAIRYALDTLPSGDRPFIIHDDSGKRQTAFVFQGVVWRPE